MLDKGLGWYCNVVTLIQYRVLFIEFIEFIQNLVGCVFSVARAATAIQSFPLKSALAKRIFRGKVQQLLVTFSGTHFSFCSLVNAVKVTQVDINCCSHSNFCSFVFFFWRNSIRLVWFSIDPHCVRSTRVRDFGYELAIISSCSFDPFLNYFGGRPSTTAFTTHIVTVLYSPYSSQLCNQNN